jgi:sugar/nucleoside kinase (ribokinase family)
MTGKQRIGVIGSFVWDVIYGRDPRSLPVEEWGGIAYTLSGLDAALSDDWEIVPLVKVGDDLAVRAGEFVSRLEHIAPDAAVIEVPYPNSRVELRYVSDERRTEVLTGGAPAWSWLGLKPVLEAARLDALLINFLTGWELDLETMRLIRQHFRGPIYCDLHMLAWAVQPTGLRTLRPLPNVREWCECFDFLQVNEEEMTMLAPDSMTLAATALHAGVRSLVVTMGKRSTSPRPISIESTICGRRGRWARRSGRYAQRWWTRKWQIRGEILPDAAMFGAQPISPGCSQVIT